MKTSSLGDTEPSEVSLLETLTVTFAVGAFPSRTVNSDLLPASVTVLLLVGVLTCSSSITGLIVKEATSFQVDNPNLVENIS